MIIIISSLNDKLPSINELRSAIKVSKEREREKGEREKRKE